MNLPFRAARLWQLNPPPLRVAGRLQHFVDITNWRHYSGTLTHAASIGWFLFGQMPVWVSSGMSVRPILEVLKERDEDGSPLPV